MSLYYTNYYSCRKHIYRERYYQKKEELQREKELFEEYGGKEKFYKDSLIKMGVLKITGDKQDKTNISSTREGVSDDHTSKG